MNEYGKRILLVRAILWPNAKPEGISYNEAVASK